MPSAETLKWRLDALGGKRPRLGKIKLPRSGLRNKPNQFLKLLKWVPCGVVAVGSYGWQGKIFRPGSEIDVDALWPDDGYPAYPVLLESAGRPPNEQNPDRGEILWLLWQLRRGQWKEIARARAIGTEWSYHLGPLAASLLEQRPPGEREAEPDYTAIAGIILSFALEQVYKLSREAQRQVLITVYDALAAAIADRSE